MKRNYFFAITILAGTIIGGGMFATPYVVSKAGLLPLFVYLPILTFVQYTLHSIYAEIILSTPQKHRMPGYVGYYKGERAKKWTLLISIIGKHGALLAYILLGGTFLCGLLSPYLGGDVFIYATILFVIESLIVLFGLRLIAGVEFILSFLLVLLVFLIAFKSQGFFSLDNFTWFDKEFVFLPYGPIFFAVGGQAAIPEICRLLNHKKEKIRSAIKWGTIFPAFLMLFFVLVVVGVSGANTSPEALVGLKMYFHNGVITASLVFGLLTIITSFLVISQSLREVYWWDLKMNNKLSWVVACGIPFLLYLLGISNITKVIGLTGSITGGIFGVILILLLFKVKKERKKQPVLRVGLGKFWAFVLCFLFILGVLYELWYFIK